jgi:hypothetical protein
VAVRNIPTENRIVCGNDWLTVLSLFVAFRQPNCQSNPGLSLPSGCRHFVCMFCFCAENFLCGRNENVAQNYDAAIMNFSIFQKRAFPHGG